MTTATSTPELLAGDTCPPWCGGGEHLVNRGEKTHSEDQGAHHASPVIDEWQGQHPDGNEPLTVRIEGFRHDFPGDGPDHGDWPDEVSVEGSVFPGYNCGIRLPAADARRLGEALVLAANLMEGKA